MPIEPKFTGFFVGIFLCVSGLVFVLLVDPVVHPNFANLGFSLIGAGISFFLLGFIDIIRIWRMEADSRWPFSVLTLFGKSRFHDADFDRQHNGRIIKKVIKRALSRGTDDLRLSGTTLHSLFGESGLVLRLLKENKYALAKRLKDEKRAIRILILNPFSVPGIIRSVSESVLFEESRSPVDRLLSHFARFEDFRLYRESKETIANIAKIKEHYPTILECRLYSCVDPTFTIITNDRAVKEDLLLSDRNKGEDKLSGRMPLLCFRAGRVRDNLLESFRFVWDNFSIPLNEHIASLETQYLNYHRLLVLSSLQRQYWEKRWSSKELPFNSFKDLCDAAIHRLKDVRVNRILDLGCGEGGGGSIELTKFAIERRSHADLVDFSQSALSTFETRFVNAIPEKATGFSKFITSHDHEMLSFLIGSEAKL